MKKTIKKIIMLSKDPDPCKECLVKAACSQVCSDKSSWDGRSRSFLVAFMVPSCAILLFCFFTMFVLLAALYALGLISEETLDKFDPFPERDDMYDDYYY